MGRVKNKVLKTGLTLALCLNPPTLQQFYHLLQICKFPESWKESKKQIYSVFPHLAKESLSRYLNGTALFTLQAIKQHNSFPGSNGPQACLTWKYFALKFREEQRLSQDPPSCALLNALQFWPQQSSNWPSPPKNTHVKAVAQKYPLQWGSRQQPNSL